MSHTQFILYMPSRFITCFVVPRIELVWKVARYTTAGPTYFTECDNYVDGGVMANNPCMEAWLEISKYYESKVSFN